MGLSVDSSCGLPVLVSMGRNKKYCPVQPSILPVFILNPDQSKQYAETSQLGSEAFMFRLQLIMVCGVLFAAGLTWQLASDAKLESQQKASIESPATDTLSELSNS